MSLYELSGRHALKPLVLEVRSSPRGHCGFCQSALAQPRQLARFLCALASPATTRAKLNRHALRGSLEGRRFAHVLAWCEALKA